jgi:hypothetical protein
MAAFGESCRRCGHALMSLTDPEETLAQAVSCKHSVSQQILLLELGRTSTGMQARPASHAGSLSAVVDRGGADQKIREDMVSPSPTSSFVYLESFT